MPEQLIELHPEHGRVQPLENLYLKQDLRSEQTRIGGTYVYANFISSLDGRIAVSDDDGSLSVPRAIANPRDWRLFQELAVQADVVLSSGRYLREYASGAQEILHFYNDPALGDLGAWRSEQGYPAYPALAIISASLDFPVPEPLMQAGRDVMVLTTDRAASEQILRLETHGMRVFTTGQELLTGSAIVQVLGREGYDLIYSAAGPRIAHLFILDGLLNRLYLTLATRLLGGTPFASILEGSLLPQPADFSMKHLYLDAGNPGPGGQLFTAFDFIPPD